MTTAFEESTVPLSPQSLGDLVTLVQGKSHIKNTKNQVYPFSYNTPNVTNIQTYTDVGAYVIPTGQARPYGR